MQSHELREAADSTNSSSGGSSSSSMCARCSPSSPHNSCRGRQHLKSNRSCRKGSQCALHQHSRSSGASSATVRLLLLLAVWSCCSVAVSACSHHQHGAAPALKCSVPAPAALYTSDMESAVAAVLGGGDDGVGDEDPIRIVYQEVSEAQLAAEVAASSARRRQLLQENPAAAAAAEEVEAAAESQAADAGVDVHPHDSSAGDDDASTLGRSVRRCGANQLTPEERSQVDLSLEQHRIRRSVLQRARLSSSSAAAALPAARTSLNVPLYFHVITGKKVNSTVDAPQELLLKQLQAMNDAYGQHGIRFDLKGITRVQSEAWAVAEINSPEENLMKAKLRKGGLGDLNIYVIRPLSGTLGWSTFPWEAIKLGESFDGVLVHVGTMPGGLMKPYNKGFTMVHEVGHWLGLLHVFENGCDSPGDSVEDTAPQASAAYGCPKTRHTCPSSNEPEPIHNIMSYTDDVCMTGFTRGQADRVLAMWDVYRSQDTQQQTNIVSEKSGSAIKNHNGQQGGTTTAKQTVKKQQGGVALLEQGVQMPESVQFTPTAANTPASSAPTSTPTTPAPAATSKQQRNSPAGPRWGGAVGNWLASNPLISFNAPGAMLEANAQVKRAQEEQQQQEKQGKRKANKEKKRSGWSSWITLGGNSGPGEAATAPGRAAATYQQLLQPELGQYPAATLQSLPSASNQQQQQQQFQYQYAQQPPAYVQQQQDYAAQLQQQHQQQQILPPGYSGPLAPQYLMGGQVGYTSDAASMQQAALLAAMGGVQAYPMAAVYDGAGAGGFHVAVAATDRVEASIASAVADAEVEEGDADDAADAPVADAAAPVPTSSKSSSSSTSSSSSRGHHGKHHHGSKRKSERKDRRKRSD